MVANAPLIRPDTCLELCICCQCTSPQQRCKQLQSGCPSSSCWAQPQSLGFLQLLLHIPDTLVTPLVPACSTDPWLTTGSVTAAQHVAGLNSNYTLSLVPAFLAWQSCQANRLPLDRSWRRGFPGTADDMKLHVELHFWSVSDLAEVCFQ